jgi:hypothetical protein
MGMFGIVGLKQLLIRRSLVRVQVGEPKALGAYRSHGLHNIPSTWFTPFTTHIPSTLGPFASGPLQIT